MDKEILFEKVCRIGTIPTWGGRHVSVYIHIELRKQAKEGPELSITGVVGPLPSGNACGGCGQIDMEFAHRNPADDDKRTVEPVKPEDFNFAPGWNREKWLDLLEIWARWHLNGTVAGSPAQEAWLRQHADEYTGHDHYMWATDALMKAGLNPDPDYFDPKTGKPYWYGHSWVYYPVPEDVIRFLKNLPSTDRQPAWV